MIWKISPSALQILKRLEKKENKGYADSGGTPTAGYGHTGPDVVIGKVYTDEQIDKWLLEDLHTCELQLASFQKMNRKDLSQNQFDALVILIFNWGYPRFKSSKLSNMVVSNPNHPLNAKEWIDIIKVGNDYSRGLLKRRLVEIALYYNFAKDLSHIFSEDEAD